jgi:ABC-type nitrate/sulfonate/bicarbonate transport system substrate-binding protein
MPARCLAALLAAAAIALGGCGASAEDRAPNRSATLLLDARPSAIHSGIYMATARGYDSALGVHLRVRAPSGSVDASKLVAAGRTDFAILDIHDLVIARERGRGLVGVMAVVQTPLEAIPGRPPPRPPRDLAGEPVDVSGAPSHPGLVLTVRRRTLQDEPALVRATIAALARGYEEVLVDPESGVGALLGATKGLRRTTVARELDAVSPSFTAGARAFGELDPQRLRAWARWERRAGIVRRTPDVRRAFDGRYVPAGGRD